MMPVLAQDTKEENANKYVNKYYLEQRLLACSVARPDEVYLKKCLILNEILNRIVRDEVRYGVYYERVKLSNQTYADIFG
jgi:hypothetical protein